jgi:hypothetical protein
MKPQGETATIRPDSRPPAPRSVHRSPAVYRAPMCELRVGMALLLLLAALVAAGPSRAECVDYDDYIRVEGGLSLTQVFPMPTIIGTLAYVADGGTLKVVDLSDPTSPHVVGQLSGCAPSPIIVSGHYGFGPSGHYVTVLDLSDPIAPHLVTQVPLPATAAGLTIVGMKLYATYLYSPTGLEVIDITDPEHPFVQGSVGLPGYANDVTVSGPYAYVAAIDWGLVIVDISNSTSPVQVGSLQLQNQGTNIGLFGSTAVLSGCGGFLQLIDVSSPTAPAIISVYPTPGGCVEDMHLLGSTVYMTTQGGGFVVLDISNPTQPRRLGSTTIWSPVRYLSVAPPLACVGTYQSRLEIINVTNPASPLIKESVSIPGAAVDVDVAGDLAYVANCVTDNLGGFQVVDISVPGNFHVIGSATLTRPPERLVAAGAFAYVADWVGGLKVMDVSDPTRPHVEGSFSTAGVAYDVDVSDTLACVGEESGLQVISVRDPAHPSLLASVPTSTPAFSLVLRSGKAYVAALSSGLLIFDVMQRPPVLLGHVITPGDARGVALAGNHAYVATELSGMTVIDISNPATPTIVATADTPFRTYNVSLGGSNAYLADEDGGLAVIDISNPLQPRYKGSADTPGVACSAVPDSSGVLIADQFHGLERLPLQCADPAMVPSEQISGFSLPARIQAWPNPSHGSFEIRFDLSQEEARSVLLSVHDAGGRLVRVLASGSRPEGSQKLSWDGRSMSGTDMPTGIYLLRLSAGAARIGTGRVMLIR